MQKHSTPQASIVFHGATYPAITAIAGPADGKTRPIDGELTIGRDDICTFAVDDPTLSRCHARVTCDEDGHLALHDCNSGSGTWMNDRRINHAPLQSGDTFRLGRSTFCVRYLKHSDTGEDVDVAPAPTAPPRRPPHRHRTVFLLLLLAGALALGAGTVFWLKHRIPSAPAARP